MGSGGGGGRRDAAYRGKRESSCNARTSAVLVLLRGWGFQQRRGGIKGTGYGGGNGAGKAGGGGLENS